MANIVTVVAGSTYLSTWQVVSATTFQLYDPGTLPTVTFIDPDGTIQVNAASTTRVSTGVYQYVWPVPADSVTGIWQGWMTAIDKYGNTVISPPQDIFTLVALPT